MIVDLTIISKQRAEFTGKKGETISGYQYAGYASDGKLIEWWSQNGRHDFVFSTKFDPKQVESVDLEAKVFAGKVKYKEN